MANCLILITALHVMTLTFTDPEPYHMLILFFWDRCGWMFLDGHPNRFHYRLGLHKEVFNPRGAVGKIFVHVSHWTYHSAHWRTLPVIKWHDLKIFLQDVGHMFVSAILHNICPSSQCQHPPFTENLPPSKLWPFFQHALGAIDGAHIACTHAANDYSTYWNWKGCLP